MAALVFARASVPWIVTAPRVSGNTNELEYPMESETETYFLYYPPEMLWSSECCEVVRKLARAEPTLYWSSHLLSPPPMKVGKTVGGGGGGSPSLAPPPSVWIMATAVIVLPRRERLLIVPKFVVVVFLLFKENIFALNFPTTSSEIIREKQRSFTIS